MALGGDTQTGARSPDLFSGTLAKPVSMNSSARPCREVPAGCVPQITSAVTAEGTHAVPGWVSGRLGVLSDGRPKGTPGRDTRGEAAAGSSFPGRPWLVLTSCFCPLQLLAVAIAGIPRFCPLSLGPEDTSATSRQQPGVPAEPTSIPPSSCTSGWLSRSPRVTTTSSLVPLHEAGEPGQVWEGAREPWMGAARAPRL